jgi:hypothetical protein
MLKYGLALIASAIVVFAGSLTATAGEKEAALDATYVPVGRLALAPPVGVVSNIFLIQSVISNSLIIASASIVTKR